MFTQEELDIITGYKELIESILTNKSCSNLPVKFRLQMRELGKKLKLNYCINCPSAIYKLVDTIYSHYKTQIENETKRKKTKVVKRGNND